MENIYSRPELLEASRAFRQEQLEGFLGIEPTICGVEVLPLTPRMAMELELSGNAFFDYGDVRAVDTALRVADRRAKLLGLDAPTKVVGGDGQTEPIRFEITYVQPKPKGE